MEKDLDMILYKEYLNGDKNAFEMLYNKYKDKINYFVYNIVKDYQKAEDITQEVFIYVMQNKMKEGYKFKYYIYLVAKSRAYNLLDMEQKRSKINEEYNYSYDKVEKDVADIVENIEKRKEILEAINMLNDRYKNAIYLVNIEELSYVETAQILGENIQNVKNLIHRGKKELRKILIKKGFDEMNKVSKVIIVILCISVLLVGGVYAAMKIIEKFTGKVEITPTYTSNIGTMDSNKVWVGTFNLVWNDFMNDVIKGKIEFVDGESKLANELNKQSFKENELSENSYFKIQGQAVGEDLKNKIKSGIKLKFNEDSKVIDKIDWNDPNGYVLYAMLKKEFEFLEPFSTAMGSMEFKNSENKVKCFGVDSSTKFEAGINVEVLFYNSEDDFAIKLKTKQGEEVILYKTTGENRSFEENYNEIIIQQNKYSGEKNFKENDILRIPFIKVNDEINYDELCGREIKNSNYYIKQAIQTIDFELNNVGGSVKSEAVIDSAQKAWVDKARKMIFDSDFILYMKEDDKEQPYFALKVDNIEVLLPDENIIEEDNNELGETSNIKVENHLTNIVNPEIINTSNNSSNNINNNRTNDIESLSSINTDIIKEDNQQAILPVIINEEESQNGGIITFIGTINDVTDECIFIIPNEDLRFESSSILIRNDKTTEYKKGQKVKVSFKGNITKSYPQNVDLISIELLN